MTNFYCTPVNEKPALHARPRDPGTSVTLQQSHQSTEMTCSMSSGTLNTIPKHQTKLEALTEFKPMPYC